MTSASFAPLARGAARLRLLETSDLTTTLAWRNHPDSRPWFLTSDAITPEGHAAWFRNYLEREDDYLFMVEQDGARVAQVSLYRIEPALGRAEFGRLLVDPERRGRGVSHLATELCLEAAQQLGIHTLTLEVKADNTRAIRAYERAGFVATGPASGKLITMVRRST